MRALGQAAGRLTLALRSFGHPGAHRELDWDIRRALASRARLAHVPDAARRDLVGRALEAYERDAAPRLPRLRHAVVHGDLNDWNVLVAADAPERITGLIDLGDAVYSVAVADLAIAATYAMLAGPSPVLALAEVAAGYHEVAPLESLEFEVLLTLVRGRLATSLTIAASRRASTDASNEYWFVTEQPGWELLERLGAVNPRHVVAIVRHACGLEPAPDAARAMRAIAAHADRLAPILDRPLAIIPKRRLAWSDPRDPMVAATVAGDVAAADAAFATWQAREQVEVGLGAWGEQRAVYGAPAFVSRLVDGARRDVHLGLDLFAPAGTTLHTPLDATILSVADCNRPQDYGGVLLLQHELDGARFRTLWGHLAPASISRWTPGDVVRAGTAIARLGHNGENGGWVPHVHLQVVCSGEDDPEGIVGVGESGLRAVWEALYPDPGALAGLPPEAMRPTPPIDEILAHRRTRLGRNLSLSYRQPLHMVRGHDVWLIDATGRAYLDCYNNVAHVGHCHPRIVGAIAAQAARLNTNTRYLHENILAYGDRLVATLPPGLDTCFFTCSGSEANELALRLARAHTGRRGVVVLDWAYHGSTTSLVEISPYKYKHVGGTGQAAHVIEAPVPDAYRAPREWPAAEIGPRFAAQLADLVARGPAPGCFIAETIPSCAGQVFVPPGFFRDAFASVRAAGGLCIMDEVQVGFGRVGNGMWAFEEHGVVPDIVTMGKPIGNGHPMGAVVTTAEIAASFANGLEYFNTFGGNPVSCAAGLAVLDVIRDQDLVRNAETRGREILAGLSALQARHASIGEVRGRGLFIGVDLVTDRDTKAPATAVAREVVNHCRTHGLLLGTDGPHDNVLKVRPPMTFGPAHVDQLLSTLSAAFHACGA